MFLVFNKEKIYAYVISVLTVCLLFLMANTTTENTLVTSSNSTLEENIYNNVINETNNNVK